MLKVGLTGGIGSGKTCVSNLFADLGVPVIDTDIIAHELVNTDSYVLKEISDTFGDDVLKQNGGLDRQKLASIVFNSKDNKQQLEKILHPKIECKVNDLLENLRASPNPPDYVIVVIPLLIEAKYHRLIDRILAVIADENIRIERVQKRDKRSLSEIRAIIDNQVDDEKRTKEADDIINNNNNIINLESKTKELHKTYLQLSKAFT